MYSFLVAHFNRSSKNRVMHLGDPAAPPTVRRSETSRQRRAKSRSTDRRAQRSLKQQPAVLLDLPTVYNPPASRYADWI